MITPEPLRDIITKFSRHHHRVKLKREAKFENGYCVSLCVASDLTSMLYSVWVGVP